MTPGRGMKWGFMMALSLIWFGGIMVDQGYATHETDHRFTVTGYVRDENGRPLSGERVIIVDKRKDLGATTFTDGDGYYESLLHLHNEDLGDEIEIMVGDQRKSIRVDFDPDDKKTERMARVDFGAPAMPGEGGSPWGRYGPVLIGVLGMVVVIGILRFRRRGKKQGKKKAKDKR